MKSLRSSLLPILGTLLVSLGAVSAAAPPRTKAMSSPLLPRDLHCEYLVAPVCVEERAPRLSWILESSTLARGQRQSAYQLLVAGSSEALAGNHGDLWDSGRVTSDRTTNVPYGGKPLTSRMQCFWKVRVWDGAGKASEWSAPASWSMGLLAPSDWQARWISYRDQTPLHKSRSELYLPAPRLYRREIQAAKPVRRAVLYASALGDFELRLNGQRVGEDLFAPGWSDYRKRAYYRAYDVTRLVHEGPNALGAILAEGWYSGYVGYGLLVGYGPNRVGRYFYGKTPALLAQLELEYTDGTHAVVGTGPDWKVTDAGPVREADILMGETYDARKEIPGWDRPHFQDASWAAAIPAEENGSTKATFSDAAGSREVELGFVRPERMEAYPGVPVRATDELKPTHVTEPKPGVFIFDLGQNFSGVARLKVKGPAGTRVRLRFGEMLHPDGTLMTENLRRARATDAYILRGDPNGESWTPRFTYHGFQYVEVTGYPGKPELDAITGVVLHSDTPRTSLFACSDPVMSRFYQNVVWTQLSNFLEVPTDCPQRDERLGWMGDAQAYVRAATYHADVSAFYTKWLRDVEEAQLPNGAYPDYAPYPMFHGDKSGYGTAWMDAGIICPYTIYQVYGDTRVIERHWDSMRRFMEFRKGRSREFRGAKSGNTWGDWLALGETTPIEYVDAVYFAFTARLMAEMAHAIHKDAEAAEYRQLFGKIQAAFKADYVHPDGTLKVETQTAYVLALWAGLLPDALRVPAAAHLAGMIHKNGDRMATGFLGTRPLLPVLTATGHHDLAVRLFQSRQFPSWGYEVANGANTVWERWNSYTKEGGIHEPSMNSFSHYAFGAVSEWMFQSLAGIDTDGPGYARITIRPGPPAPASAGQGEPSLNWVRAGYQSPHGLIRSDWRRTGRRFELTVAVPPNTTATIYLPATHRDTITEGGKPLQAVEGVRFLRTEGDRAVLLIGSGKYEFKAEVGS